MMDMFNDWIRAHGLDDVDICNRKFTWSNKRVDPTMAQLDRVLINTAWLLSFTQTSEMVTSSVTSDHVPLLVQFGNNKVKSNLFEMENHWLHLEETRAIIQNS